MNNLKLNIKRTSFLLNYNAYFLEVKNVTIEYEKNKLSSSNIQLLLK